MSKMMFSPLSAEAQLTYKHEITLTSLLQDDSRGDWCIENVKGLWLRDMFEEDDFEVFFFELEEDAVLFSLKWC